MRKTITSIAFKNIGLSKACEDIAEFSHNRNTGINIISGDNASDVLEEIVNASNDHHDAVHLVASGFGDKQAATIKSIDAIIEDVTASTIIIPEIKTPSQAVLALLASMQGFRVWTTIKTNTLFGVFNRFTVLLCSHEFDLGYKANLNTLLSDSVITSAFHLKSIDKLCPKCKVKEVMADMKDKGFVNRISPIIDNPLSLYSRGSGCSECSAGVKGKVIVSEGLATDPEMLNLMLSSGFSKAHGYWLQKQEGQTLIQDSVTKIKEGIIDPVDVEASVSMLNLDAVLNDGQLHKEELIIS